MTPPNRAVAVESTEVADETREPIAGKARLKVAIVGAGPAAFFTAEALLEQGTGAEIDIIERLPVPFGLARFGVAPDHQTTKRVTDAFEAVLAHADVAYFGNVQMGRDVTLARLTMLYDAVVVATGAPADVPFRVPGSDLPGCFGAARFVGWYNGHPDARHLAPTLEGGTTAVIGMGNVALDAVRMLSRTPDELASTDLSDHALEALAASRITDIHVIGRRGPMDAKFTYPELKEIGSLPGVTPVVDPADLPNPDSVMATSSRAGMRLLSVFWEFARARPKPSAKRVHFRFWLSPVEVLGETKVSGLRLCRSDGSFFDLDCGTIISSIGYRSAPVDGLPFDGDRSTFHHDGGRVSHGVYVTGWARRGASGVIGTNKPDAADIASRVLSECTSDPAKAGRSGLSSHLGTAGCRWITRDAWRRIDDHERRAARAGAPRRKLVSVEDMLEIGQA